MAFEGTFGSGVTRRWIRCPLVQDGQRGRPWSSPATKIQALPNPSKAYISWRSATQICTQCPSSCSLTLTEQEYHPWEVSPKVLGSSTPCHQDEPSGAVSDIAIFIAGLNGHVHSFTLLHEEKTQNAHVRLHSRWQAVREASRQSYCNMLEPQSRDHLLKYRKYTCSQRLLAVICATSRYSNLDLAPDDVFYLLWGQKEEHCCMICTLASRHIGRDETASSKGEMSLAMDRLPCEDAGMPFKEYRMNLPPSMSAVMSEVRRSDLL